MENKEQKIFNAIEKTVKNIIKKTEIKIQLSSEKAKLPEYQTAGASGLDLVSIEDHLVLKPGEVKAISTGLSVAVPEGYEIQIRPRSGLALKNSITVLNTPGTIDSDYRGIIQVILVNFGTKEFNINPGDRIAQMIVCPVAKANFIIVDNLEETKRGTGGFGSTGT